VSGAASGGGGAAPRTACLVVDCQVDFCPGGSLPVEGGDRVAAAITRRLGERRPGGPLVVTSRDWHVDPGGHFAAEGAAPDYATTWPPHCVAGTPGAEYHPALRLEPDAEVRKGAHAAAYSAFEGQTEDGRPLLDVLRGAGVGEVQVCGIATDHCVRATALDARRLGFRVVLLGDLCAGVSPHTTAAALAEMTAAGVEVVDSAPG
jgi:nicotinamidase/pyrazinamidase